MKKIKEGDLCWFSKYNCFKIATERDLLTDWEAEDYIFRKANKSEKENYYNYNLITISKLININQFILDVFHVCKHNVYRFEWSNEYMDLISIEIELIKQDYEKKRKFSFDLAHNKAHLNFLNRMDLIKNKSTNKFGS